MRTVKSVLESDESLMPPKSICSICPDQEYKEIKNLKDQSTKTMQLKSKNELKFVNKKGEKIQTKIKHIQQKMKEKNDLKKKAQKEKSELKMKKKMAK